MKLHYLLIPLILAYAQSNYAQIKSDKEEIIQECVLKLLGEMPELAKATGKQLQNCTIYILENEVVDKGLQISIPNENVCIYPKTVLFQLGLYPDREIEFRDVWFSKSRATVSIRLSYPKFPTNYEFELEKVNSKWKMQ